MVCIRTELTRLGIAQKSIAVFPNMLIKTPFSLAENLAAKKPGVFLLFGHHFAGAKLEGFQPPYKSNKLRKC